MCTIRILVKSSFVKMSTDRIRSPPKRQKSSGAADDLVSVTVKKSVPEEKAGIKMVQKHGGIFITKITKNGLFDDTELEVDDRVLSINGKRIRPGESAKDFINHVTTAHDKVTIVVKKANLKPSSAARSLSPNRMGRRRKKIVTKQVGRNADGSFDYSIDPTVENYVKETGEFDDKEQYRFRANKIFERQGAGLSFKKIDDMLFVSGINLDSIFRDTNLQLGDRICQVNGSNFMSYVDENYATTLLKRAKGECELIVEKGWKCFNGKTDTDDSHGKPSRDSLLQNRGDSRGDLTSNTSIDQMRSRRNEEQNKKSTKSEKGYMLKTSDHSTSHMSGDSKGIQFLEHKGDYCVITIKKKSESKPGIKVKKTEGKFILKKVPSYEKRVPLGSKILAINGSSDFSSVDEAKDLIQGTKEKVVLIIDFEEPVLQQCPCCGKWMTMNGEHFTEEGL